MVPNNVAAAIRAALTPYKSAIEQLKNELDSVKNSTQSVDDYINSIPGRRVMYNLVGTQTFTSSQDGVRGNAINMLVSQDGPFVMTHYPLVMWKPSLPTNATDFGRWRPIYHWPLASQQLTTDFIDISYELVDGGSQRQLQNAASPPLLSRPDQLHELPIPTLFAPNTTIQFYPTYEDITFGGGTATTQGTLAVTLPGYRIVQA